MSDNRKNEDMDKFIAREINKVKFILYSVSLVSLFFVLQMDEDEKSFTTNHIAIVIAFILLIIHNYIPCFYKFLRLEDYDDTTETFLKSQYKTMTNWILSVVTILFFVILIAFFIKKVYPAIIGLIDLTKHLINKYF